MQRRAGPGPDGFKPGGTVRDAPREPGLVCRPGGARFFPSASSAFDDMAAPLPSRVRRQDLL
ncbi:hypothetical protein DSECCO2_448360 [anaerobic digester metagenome]